MASGFRQALANHIENRKAEIEQLETILKLFDSNPALAEQLSALALDPVANGVTNPVRIIPAGDNQSETPQLDRVLAYFRSQDHGVWRTVKQIAEGTGLTRNSVNFLLYTSKHKELFEGHVAGPKKKLWRIKGEQDDEGATTYKLPSAKHAVKRQLPPAKHAPKRILPPPKHGPKTLPPPKHKPEDD